MKLNSNLLLDCVIDNINTHGYEITWFSKSKQKICSSNNFLNFESLNNNDQGEYECIARNSFGNTTKTVQVNITRKNSLRQPIIIKKEFHKQHNSQSKRNSISVQMVSSPFDLKKYGNLELKCLSGI